jgi:hypothetical protein
MFGGKQVNLLDLLIGPATRKAQVAALATAAGTVLAAVLPETDGTVARIIVVILAVLAAFGITYQTPNKGTGA